MEPEYVWYGGSPSGNTRDAILASDGPPARLGSSSDQERIGASRELLAFGCH
jgi:hypothetical protein